MNYDLIEKFRCPFFEHPKFKNYIENVCLQPKTSLKLYQWLPFNLRSCQNFLKCVPRGAAPSRTAQRSRKANLETSGDVLGESLKRESGVARHPKTPDTWSKPKLKLKLKVTQLAWSSFCLNWSFHLAHCEFGMIWSSLSAYHKCLNAKPWITHNRERNLGKVLSLKPCQSPDRALDSICVYRFSNTKPWIFLRWCSLYYTKKPWIYVRVEKGHIRRRSRSALLAYLNPTTTATIATLYHLNLFKLHKLFYPCEYRKSQNTISQNRKLPKPLPFNLSIQSRQLQAQVFRICRLSSADCNKHIAHCSRQKAKKRVVCSLC